MVARSRSRAAAYWAWPSARTAWRSRPTLVPTPSNSVVFATPITNIVASVDFSTVLQAVTFRGADTFTPTVQANAGQEGPQQFLWSNAANWTEGAPVNGDSILTTYKSLSTEYQLPIDDIQI